MLTLDQQRAAHALARVQELSADDDFKGSYRAYADRLGPAIMMNGLGQALATECAAAGRSSDDAQTHDRRAHRTLYNNVADWLCRPEGGVYPRASHLLEALMAGDEDAYLRAQAEAMAWLGWHKKFCHAELSRRARSGGEAGDDEG